MTAITNRTRHALLVVACAASAGVHAALAPEHLRESTATGAGFVASAVLLAAVVVALSFRPGDRLVVASAGLTLGGLIVLYGLATTSGVPVLQPQPEAVDGLALATKAVELAGVLAAAAALVQVSNRHPQGAAT